MDQSSDHVLEDQTIRDALAVTPEGMGGGDKGTGNKAENWTQRDSNRDAGRTGTGTPRSRWWYAMIPGALPVLSAPFAFSLLPVALSLMSL